MEHNEPSVFYFNSNCLLVVNSKGIIRILFTPFRVITIDCNCGIPEGTILFVEEIGSDKQDKLYFIIFGHPYFHFYFYVPVEF